MYKRIKSPFNVQVEVTGSCTHVCGHCYNYWRPKAQKFGAKRSKGITINQIDSILSKLQKAEVFDIIVTGGEPLMNYDAVLHLVRKAKEIGFGVSLNSNLVLLSKKRAIELKLAGINHILTSILGPDSATHDTLANLPRAFEMLERGFQTAIKAGIRVTANMVVTKQNCGLVKETGLTAMKFGANRFFATKAGCPGNCVDFSGIALSKHEVVNFLNDLCFLKREKGLNVDTLEPIPLCLMESVENPNLFVHRRCSAGVTTMTVGSGGDVRPCSHFNLSFGNILTEDVEVIWKRMNLFAEGLQIPPVCKDCKLLNLCGAGCRMEAMMFGKRLDSLDPYATPENSSAVATRIVREVKSLPVIDEDTMFELRPFRIRKETFGSVVSVGSGVKTLLGHDGTKVILQIPIGIHSISRLKIDWFGIKPAGFVTGLVERDVVRFPLRR